MLIKAAFAVVVALCAAYVIHGLFAHAAAAFTLAGL